MVVHVAHNSIRCRLYVLAWLPEIPEDVRKELDRGSAAERKALTKMGYYPRAVTRPVHRVDGPLHERALGVKKMSKEECRRQLVGFEDEAIQWPDPQDIPLETNASSSDPCRFSLSDHFGFTGQGAPPSQKALADLQDQPGGSAHAGGCRGPPQVRGGAV